MPPTPVPPPKSTSWAFPALRLRVDDLRHKGAAAFFAAVEDPGALLGRAVEASVKWLYTPETAPTHVEEIMLILLPMAGVAATSGTRTHKEIRFSLDYVLGAGERAADEIAGVIVHEVVHCFQHDARGSCPGGLIEGIAGRTSRLVFVWDYVRLREHLAPPHWARRAGAHWDAGYETTAYFLAWLEETWGDGTVRRLNAALADVQYDACVFADVAGVDVDELWVSYCDALSALDEQQDREQEPERSEPLADWPAPRLAVRIDDLDHAGADVFLAAVQPKDALRAAVKASFARLYTLADVPTHLQSVTLVLREMDGVAHTCGPAAHREIHFSLAYIAGNRARARDEIMGVLVHEAVHCVQYDARGTCPGGLIEGMADYVRLHEDLGPPHWKRKGGEKWDAGYDLTAYFLAWLDDTSGQGTVQRLNAALKRGPYDERVFSDLTGKTVDALWAEYCASLEEAPGSAPGSAGGVVRGSGTPVNIQ